MRARTGLIAVAVSLVLASPASAGTITVTSTADGGTGTLRAAIAAAPSSPTTIALPSGTITLHNSLNIAGRSLTIVGQGAATTAISGGGATQILNITDASTVALQQLTLRDGFDADASVVSAPAAATLSLDHVDVRDNHSSMTADGNGAFELNGGSLSMSSGTVADNVAGGGGHSATGGIVHAQHADVTVTDETFSGNQAGGGGGAATGALFAVADGSAPNSTLTLTRVTARDNHGGGGGGAGAGFGLVDADGYDVVVTDSTFTANTLGGGSAGGFALVTATADDSRAARVTLTRSTVTANTIGPGGGGGTGGAVSVSNTGDHASLSVSVLGSLISSNVVGGDGGLGFGGAVNAAGTGTSTKTTVVIAGSTIAGNSVGAGSGGVGGAVAMSGTAATGLSIDRSTLTGNAAGSSAGHDGYGGAVELAGGAAATITASTIAGNHVDGPKGHGGAIYGATATLGSSIVAGNTAADRANCATTVVSRGANLDSGNGCGFTAAGDLHDTDPRLAPLGDYGGPLPTQALLVGSPAANAAGACSGSDERGVVRPQGRACDIGAVEAALPGPPTTLAPLKLTPGTATLAGMLAPTSDPVAARFETGDSPSYGTALTALVAPDRSASGPIKNLARRTTYHARLDVTSAAGTVTGNDVTFTTPAPVATVSHFTLSPAAFRPVAAARSAKPHKRTAAGSAFRFTASDQGAAAVLVTHTAPGRRSGRSCVKPTHKLRHHAACTRTLTDGTVRFRVAKAGKVNFPFSGRVGHHVLGAATYTASLTLRADASPAASRPATARFTVRR